MNRFLATATTYADYFSDANYHEFAEPMQQVDSVGNSIYHILIMIACFAGVVILMCVGMKMSIGNSKEKASAKDKLISTICVLTAIFALAFLINEVVSIVSGFRIW